jgi:phage/plasmid-associated DNA primase
MSLKALQILRRDLNNELDLEEPDGEKVKELNESIIEIEELIHRKCNDCKYCKYYSEGKQPDGLLWEMCDENWECANKYESKFEVKEVVSEIKVKIDAEVKMMHIDFKI